MAKYRPSGVKKPLVMPEEYKDWTIEELRDTLKPNHHAFANEYLANGGNKTAAYRDAIWIKKPGNKQRFKTLSSEKVIKLCSKSAHDYLAQV
jgi:hypothetical protein